jgi:hypothetical protein
MPVRLGRSAGGTLTSVLPTGVDQRDRSIIHKDRVCAILSDFGRFQRPARPIYDIGRVS